MTNALHSRGSFTIDDPLGDYFAGTSTSGTTEQIREATKALASHSSSESEQGSPAPSRQGADLEGDLDTISEDQLLAAMSLEGRAELGASSPRSKHTRPPSAPSSPLVFNRVLVTRNTSIHEPADQEKVRNSAEKAAQLFADFLDKLTGEGRVLFIDKQVHIANATPLPLEQLEAFKSALQMALIGKLQCMKEFFVNIAPGSNVLDARLDPLIMAAMGHAKITFKLKGPPLYQVLVTRETALIVGRDSSDKSVDLKHAHSPLPPPALPAYKSPGGASRTLEVDKEAGLPIIPFKTERARALRKQPIVDRFLESVPIAEKAAEAITKKLKVLNRVAPLSDEKYENFQNILSLLLYAGFQHATEFSVKFLDDPFVEQAAKMSGLILLPREDVHFWITKDAVVIMKSDSSATSGAGSTDLKDEGKQEAVRD